MEGALLGLNPNPVRRLPGEGVPPPRGGPLLTALNAIEAVAGRGRS